MNIFLRAKHFVKDNPILGSTLGVTLITLLLKIAGYLEKIVLAYYYGTADEVDVYLMVVGVIISVFVLFRELVEPGFLQVFLKLQEAGDKKESWQLFRTIFILIFLFSQLFVLLGVVFTEDVVRLFAPGFSGEKLALAIELLRIGSWALIFLTLSSLTGITLNAFKRFALPAFSELLFKGAVIIALIISFPVTGIKGACLGLVIGAFLRLLLQFLGLKKHFVSPVAGWRTPHLRSMAYLTLPLLVGMIFSQLNFLIDNYFASYLGEGKISSLSYAKKIIEAPVVAFPYVLGMVVFPYFSQLSITRQLDKLYWMLGESLKWITIFFLPLSIFLSFESTAIVKLLLERGQFDSTSTLLTSAPLHLYAYGLLAFSVEAVLVLFYFSTGDTRTPIIVGMLGVVLNVVLTIFLVQYYDYLGIAAATVISKTLKVIVLLFLLRNKFRMQSSGPARFTLKLLLSSLGFLVGVWSVSNFWGTGSGTVIDHSGRLCMELVLGGVLFLAMAYWTGLPLKPEKAPA